MLPSASRYASVLAVLRIFAGAAWFSHGVLKLTNPHWATPGGAFESFVREMTDGQTGFYHDFIVGVVLTHANVFSMLVGWGETLTGVSLLLGLLTPVGGIVGAFLTLNYWMAKGDFAHIASLGGLDLATAALSLVNAALPTGLVFGLDGLIARRRNSDGGPKVPATGP
jgi:uncharacterized membrane protein YphA (DoxX/SURF4 family)